MRGVRAGPGRGLSAVVFVQRFDSGLRINLHFHAVWADGVFAHELGSRQAEFWEHGEVTDADVAKLAAMVRDRVLRYLRRLGRMPADDESTDAAPGDDDLLVELTAASVQGRAALGEHVGKRDQRVGRGTRDEPFVKGPLCAEVEGFSLHAAVRVEGRARDRLERLCRYAGRAAIAENRLTELPDGRLVYSLKKRWKDGTTHLVMSRQVLMERLCALVPRPRRHLVTYHGVFAPAAGIRPLVVPSRVIAQDGEENGASGAAAASGGDQRGPDGAPACAALNTAGQLLDAAVRMAVDGTVPDSGVSTLQAQLSPLQCRSPDHMPGTPRKRRLESRQRYLWAELMRRVHLLEVLVCPHCGGARRVLAAIHDPNEIRKVLRSMGLSDEVPVPAAARSPPRQTLLEFES